MEYFKYIARDAVQRAVRFTAPLRHVPLLAILIPRGAHAANTKPFEPVPTLSKEQQDSVNQEGGNLDFDIWVDRGMKIRGGDSVYQCLANLTAALDLVGQLNNAEYNGAAGALSLLPTAGALLGAPTREMWIVYKLVPVAGILTMFLSLGGSITPSNIGEYDPAEPFSYGGFMPTTRVATTRHKLAQSMTPDTTPPVIATPATPIQSQNGFTDSKTDADEFAEEVLGRVKGNKGGGVRFGVFLAMALQFILIVALLIPMWYAQRGAVVTWWCRVWGWMYFWYFLVSGVSVFDNLVAAPFKKSWTIRVSQRPTGIITDHTVPKLTDCAGGVLGVIKDGPNTYQKLRLDSRASTVSRTCFYVVISIKGISRVRAISQIIAKAASVAVFAFGTALFASATLMSISIALMVLCILLASGVAGRVLAMWIVAQISFQNKPILHKLVADEAEAGQYVDAIVDKYDLQLELGGHVIIDARCVKSRNILFSPSTYLGLLAKPFDAVAAAERSPPVIARMDDVSSIGRSHHSSPRSTHPPASEGYEMSTVSAV